MTQLCAIVHSESSWNEADTTGCLLPTNHAGPHEFKDRLGRVWCWVTDMTCTCEHCLKCEGDYCTEYWLKEPSQ